MTENFFIAALLITMFALFCLDGLLAWAFFAIAVACAVLGLLNGYGVLPEWQG